MNTPSVKLAGRLAAAAAAALLASPLAARAEGFSTANAQLLQGWSFHDNLLGYDTKSGTMTTLTLNHYGTWEYGDSFAFVDFYTGQFVNGLTPTGSTADLYAEWHPRLFLERLVGRGALGPVRHWGLAGEVNQSRDFRAYLGGLGFDLEIPGFTVAGVNLYYRYGEVNVRYVDAAAQLTAVTLYQSTFQLSPFWTVPFRLGPTRFLFTGFVDVFRDAKGKLDVMAQPELLLDVGAFLGAPDRLHAGVEWYVHSFRNPDPSRGGIIKVVSSPQAMVQWTVY